MGQELSRETQNLREILRPISFSMDSGCATLIASCSEWVRVGGYKVLLQIKTIREYTSSNSPECPFCHAHHPGFGVRGVIRERFNMPVLVFQADLPASGNCRDILILNFGRWV